MAEANIDLEYPDLEASPNNLVSKSASDNVTMPIVVDLVMYSAQYPFSKSVTVARYVTSFAIPFA